MGPIVVGVELLINYSIDRANMCYAKPAQWSARPSIKMYPRGTL